MKKRFIALFLIFVFAVSLVPGAAVAANVVTSGKCGDNVKWELSAKGVLTITGTGSMFDYDWNESPFSYNNSINSVMIKSGVTSIGD